MVLCSSTFYDYLAREDRKNTFQVFEELKNRLA